MKGPDMEIDPDTFLREVDLFLDEEFNYPQKSEGNETSHKGSPIGVTERLELSKNSCCPGT